MELLLTDVFIWALYFVDFLIGFTIVFAIRLLIGFSILMKFKRLGWHKNPATRQVVVPLGVAFAILDIVFDYLVSIFYWDLPATPDETFTWRMKRYKKEKLSTGYHHKSAVLFCRLLNWISKEDHC